MAISIFRFSLDVHKTQSQITISASKYSTDRRLMIRLMERGIPYVIEDGSYAVFSAVKPDGKKIYNDCSIRNNTIIYDFTKQTTAAVGILPCQIHLYGANGRTLVSSKFKLIVHEAVYVEEDIESSDEYLAFSGFINRFFNSYDWRGEKVFIRYSANSDGTDFTETWTEGQNYIGIATGLEDPEVAGAYQWSLLSVGGGGSISDEQIAEAVSKYLTEHPIESPEAAESAEQAGKSAEDALTAAAEAAESARNAEQKSTTAEGARDAAAQKAAEASSAAQTATTAASDAERAKTEATTSAQTASTAATNATEAKEAAETAKGQAEQSATNATAAKTAAETAQTAAEGASNTATQKATEATNAAQTAASKATAATEANASAQSAKSGAEAAKAAAQTAAENAEALKNEVERKLANGDYTPIKGVDFFTPSDKAELVAEILVEMGAKIIGTIDDEGNIVVRGTLADGTYTVKYEMEGGSTVKIGDLVLGEDEPDEPISPSYKNLLPTAQTSATDTTVYDDDGWKADSRLSGSSHNVSGNTGTCVIGLFKCTGGDTVYIKGFTFPSSGYGRSFYGINSSNAYVSQSAVTLSTLTPDANGVVSFKVPSKDGIEWGRFECATVAADAIITVNEPIV